MKEIKGLLEKAIARFNLRWKENAELREALEGVERKVELQLGEHKYSFTLADGRIKNFREQATGEPDVRITSDAETIRGLLNRELSFWKAYAIGKVKLQAPISDLLILRKFIK